MTCLGAENSEQDPFLLIKKCGSNNAAIRVIGILLKPQLALCWGNISQKKVAVYLPKPGWCFRPMFEEEREEFSIQV